MSSLKNIQHLFIITPSAVLDSPVKGAIALANEVVNFVPVTIIFLKSSCNAHSLINSDVKVVTLNSKLGWVSRLFQLRNILSSSGDPGSIASISSCFSADFLNSFCADIAITCSSVRGDLFKVYPYSYGVLGKVLATIHMQRLKHFNYVVSMTKDMSTKVSKYIKHPSPVIGNFIDEKPLEFFRRNTPNSKEFRFVFTGSLTKLKQPELLIYSINKLITNGVNVRLDVMGDGPLRKLLEKKVSHYKINVNVIFHGYEDMPYGIVALADVLVLPSLTEGISRSVLEALYLGVPSILRNIDGSKEIINKGINGALFEKDEELSGIMLEVANWSRENRCFENNLLPEKFKQSYAAKQYLRILDN